MKNILLLLTLLISSSVMAETFKYPTAGITYKPAIVPPGTGYHTPINQPIFSDPSPLPLGVGYSTPITKPIASQPHTLPLGVGYSIPVNKPIALGPILKSQKYPNPDIVSIDKNNRSVKGVVGVVGVIISVVRPKPISCAPTSIPIRDKDGNVIGYQRTDNCPK